jgi:hypothetical protein
MQQHYKPLHEQARNLEFRVRDLIDQPGHPTSVALRNETHKLTEEIEMDKNPRAIEERVKVIQRQIDQAEHHGEAIMNVEHLSDLHHHYEGMRSNIRRMPGY